MYRFLLDPETQEVVGEVRAQAETFVLSGGPIGSPLVPSNPSSKPRSISLLPPKTT